MKYKIIVCGGTFDFLHKGHKSFLKQIFNQAEKVIIGLTSDLYISKFKIGISEDFKARKENLLNFLAEEKLTDKLEIVPIDDIYGPLLDENLNVDAIAVTKETNKSGIQINEKRKSLGLPIVDILVFELDLAEDNGLISSTRIRNGEIDRNGKLFINPNWKGKIFKLPQNLRSKLHEPFGKILDSIPKIDNGHKIIAIGDITTQKFNGLNVGQLLSIIDFVVKRQKEFDNVSDLGFSEDLEIIKVDNPAGQITWDLFQAILDSLKDKKNKIILVNGEEDLAVLPAILAAPLGFEVFYGQPNVGLVEIEITEEIKEKAYILANKFNLS